MPTVTDSPVIAMLETGNTATWPLDLAANKPNQGFTPKEVKGKGSTKRSALMFERFLTTKCRFDSEMPLLYTEGWKQNDGEPLYIRRGLASSSWAMFRKLIMKLVENCGYMVAPRL